MNRPTKGGSSSHGDPARQTTPRPDRVTRLKQQIALGRYSVDADAVAREMLFKLRLLRAAADRSRPAGAQSRRGHATQRPRPAPPPR